MTDFFISYTQSDRAWAEWIAWVLEENGYSTTIQAWDFRAGGNFVLDMHRAAADADRTVAVLSPEYLESRFCAPEWAAAYAKDPTGEHGALLPVRVRDVKLKGLWPQITYIDLLGADQDTSRIRLLAGIQRTRAKPSSPSTFPGSSIKRPFPESTTENPTPAFSIDELPAPGSLPPGSRMPFAVNPLFVGRQEALRILARQLKAGETSVINQVEIAAATGLGGIGKTQLASEFVHRYGRYFEGGVFWMNFADPAAVPAEVAACGWGLALHPNYGSLPLDEQIQLVESVWTRSIPRLLVFDNCEEESLLDRWRPRFGGARVLVTSRRSRWDPVLAVGTVALATLPRSESVELLRCFRKNVPVAEETVLSDIAVELGGLPLALHLAGSYLERYAKSPLGQPAAYLKALRQDNLLKHPSLQGKFAGISPTSHEAHVGRTFALSFERLNLDDRTDALAIAFLTRAAYFAPGEPIPRDLLLETVSLDDEESYLQAEDALGRLMALGLLEQGEADALVMHRLVAVFAQGTGDAAGARGAVEETVLAEAARLDDHIPGPLLIWQSHLWWVTEVARSREDAKAADLCALLASHLQTIGDLLRARPYYERALEIRQRILEPEHPEIAKNLNDLGLLLQRQGAYNEALVYLERALKILEKDPENSNTAACLNNIGSVLRDQGDYTRALANYQQALSLLEKAPGLANSNVAAAIFNNLGRHYQESGHLVEASLYFARSLTIWEMVLSPDHPHISHILNNIGLLLDEQGDSAGARKHLERSLAIREKTLGYDHPYTAESLSNLGSAIGLDDIPTARSYLQRALAIRKKMLGPEHPDTANSLRQLGTLLKAQGDYVAAFTCYEQSLAILEKTLGSEHPDTASSLERLGSLFEAQGDYSTALTYYERSLAIEEKVLGPKHPRIAISLNNLGGLLIKMREDVPFVRSCYERALTIQEEIFGPEHPETATILSSIGSLLHDQGDYTEARMYYDKALAIRDRILGSEHPRTATSLDSIGGLLDSQGSYEEARLYYERALAIREKTLGPEHPDTATSLHNIGYLLDNQGNYEEARLYYERALVIEEKVLGPEHPSTATSLHNIGYLLDNQGNYEEARLYYERALTIREKILGPEHPDTATNLHNIGYLLSNQGNYEEARLYYERALAIEEKVLGPEHPSTATSLNNIGSLLDSQGNYEEARLYYERALAIRERVLGPEHPSTATSLNNFGFLLRRQRDFAGARLNYERALAIREKVLGPEHLDTATSLNNLGALYLAQLNLPDARRYFERAYEIREKILGREHPDTKDVRRNLETINHPLRSVGRELLGWLINLFR